MQFTLKRYPAVKLKKKSENDNEPCKKQHD